MPNCFTSTNNIFKVHNYFKMETTEGVKDILKVLQRIAQATGTSISTVQKILRRLKNL